MKFLLLLALLPGTLATMACAVDPQAADSGAPQTISICGSTIDLSLKGDTQNISRSMIVNWVNRAATAVCKYYGKYPVPHTSLNVQVRGGSGVSHGVTYPAENGGRIRISVGSGTTQADLDDDWMLTHEMIHQAFPYMTENHHWIEEGISVYVEPIARVQAGQLSATQMWRDVVRDMPQGEPEFGDEGLDRTHTWGRTYWGGAMFCLVADVRIREQTHNRKGLQDALRGILEVGGNIDQDWPIERAFDAGDKATGTTVLMDLYRQMRESDVPTDLASLWQQLGIEKKSDGTLAFNSHAKLAGVREAITSPTNAVAQREKLQ